MRIFILALATGGGSGYAPMASGTFGSAVGLLVWLATWRLGLGPIAYALLVLGIVGIGIWAADRAQAIFRRHDDGRITIDEIAGMLVSLAWLPARLEVVLSAFVLFRLFDIWKPVPASTAERLPGGLGVMADDLVAGVYANVAGQLLWRVIFTGSSA